MTDVRFIGHRKVDLYCSGGDTCGDAETTLQKTIRLLEGCEGRALFKDRLRALGRYWKSPVFNKW